MSLKALRMNIANGLIAAVKRRFKRHLLDVVTLSKKKKGTVPVLYQTETLEKHFIRNSKLEYCVFVLLTNNMP